MTVQPLAGNIHFTSTLFDFQLLRSLHHARYGGPDFGECFAICFQVKEGDWEGWYAAWMNAAERTRLGAESFLARANPASARRMFLRAFECYRSAIYPLLGNLQDPRLLPTVKDMQHCFRQAGKLMSPPMQVLEIPYEATTLPGYFLPADPTQGKRPTLIINCGYTTFCEESYFLGGVAALQRGWNILLYDGPGQGSSLVQQNLYFRPDWDRVLSPLLDHALTLPAVDPKRIAVFGRSFNALLSTRGVAFDRRVAALLLDPAENSKYRDTIRDFPQAAVAAFERGEDNPLAQHLERQMQNPDYRFSLHCRMLSHGSKTPLDYIRELKKYDLAELLSRIQCPTAISSADHDDRGTEQARQVYEALTCPKAYFDFHAEQGAGEHCQVGAPELCYQTFYDWLSDFF